MGMGDLVISGIRFPESPLNRPGPVWMGVGDLVICGIRFPESPLNPPRPVWMGVGDLVISEIRFPDRLAPNELLYPLSYPCPHVEGRHNQKGGLGENQCLFFL